MANMSNENMYAFLPSGEKHTQAYKENRKLNKKKRQADELSKKDEGLLTEHEKQKIQTHTASLAEQMSKLEENKRTFEADKEEQEARMKQHKKDLDREINKLRQENKEKNRTIGGLKRQMKEAEEVNANMKSDIDHYKQEYMNIKNAHEHLKQEHVNLRNANEHVNYENGRLQNENNRLRSMRGSSNGTMLEQFMDRLDENDVITPENKQTLIASIAREMFVHRNNLNRMKYKLLLQYHCDKNKTETDEIQKKELNQFIQDNIEVD